LIARTGAKLVSHRVHLPIERTHLAMIAMEFRLLLFEGDFDELLYQLINRQILELSATHGFRTPIRSDCAHIISA
jgi:hypothetical protein